MAQAPAPIDLHTVKEAYRNDEINARQYHQAMWKLSRQSFEERVLYSGGTIGAVKAAINQVWDDWTTRYDEIQQSVKSEGVQQKLQAEMKQTGKMPEAIYATPESFGERMWKDLNAVIAPINRTAELSGNGWKQMAKAIGTPDWMASMIGFAAETSASFVLSGKPMVKAQAALGQDIKAIGRGIKKFAGNEVGAIELRPEVKKMIDGIDSAIAGEVKTGGGEAFQAGQDAVNDLAKYGNPLQAAVVNFAKSSSEQARGTAMAKGAAHEGMRRTTHAATMERAAALPPLTAEEPPIAAGFTRYYRSNPEGVTTPQGTHWVKDKNYIKEGGYGEPNIYVDVPNSHPYVDPDNYGQIPTRITIPLNSDLAKQAKPIPGALEAIGQTAPGTTLNAEQIVKAQMPFKEALSQLYEIAPKVVDGDPAAGLAFDAINQRLLDPVSAVEAIKTETGRATEILRATTPIHEQIANLHDIYAAFGPEAAAAGNWDSARARLAGKIMDLGQTPEDVQKVYDIANTNLTGERGKTYGELFRQVYTSILLAKPATWVKKTLGDVQGAFDKSLQYSFGAYMSPDQKGLLNSEGPLAARVMLQSLMHGMGFTVEGRMGRFVDPAMHEAFDFATKSKDIPEAMAKFVGRRNARTMSGFMDYGGDPEKWNIPGRVFENITSFAQHTGSVFGQYMSAHREALKLGMGDTPAILNEFVANRMAYPTKDMLMEGISAAGEMTYTNPMGTLGHAVQKAVQGWGPAWMITPFFHIPANIVNRGFSNIPLVNLFTKGVVDGLEKGGVERDLQLGRLAMAQMSSQFLWLMAKGGLVTGHGPDDPKERQVWLANGNKPDSFHFGNTWIPYGFLGALGIQASVIADTAYVSDYFDQPSLENMTGSLLISGARAVANEPFFESWGRLSRALQDPEKSGLKALGDGVTQMLLTPASVLTGGPVVATAARALDPFSKSVDNMLDDIKQNIPFLRSGVPNALNPLTAEKNPLPAPWGAGWLRGNNSMWAQAAQVGMAEINPVASWDSPVSTDPVIKEMNRVGATFPNFRVNYGSRGAISGAAPEPGQAPPINLTSAEAEGLIKQFATRKFDGTQTIREFLLEQINDPSYKDPSFTRTSKKTMFESILRGNNAGAFMEFKATHPEVAYRYAVSGLEKILSAVSPEERAQLQQEYLQGQNDALQSTNEGLQNENTQMHLEAADRQYQESATPPAPPTEEPAP